MSLAVLSLVAIGGAFAARLGETPVLPATPYDYGGIALPSYLDVSPILKWVTTPADNPISDAGATLGRVLFYDVRLSQNEAVSCASCHRQEHGFADPRPLSAGFQGEPTARNSMALAFPRYDRNRQFFWDERARTLEDLTLEPIQDPVEMGLTLDDLTARLEATAFYPGLFAAAFGTPEMARRRWSGMPRAWRRAPTWSACRPGAPSPHEPSRCPAESGPAPDPPRLGRVGLHSGELAGPAEMVDDELVQALARPPRTNEHVAVEVFREP